MRSIVIIVLLTSISLFSNAQNVYGKHTKKHIEKTYHKQNRKDKNYIVIKGNSVKRNGPPFWAPAHGYRHRYVYFPAHHCYYDNYKGIYIYLSNKVWITSFSIPSFINPIKARKVELTIDNIDRPQIYFEHHITVYK